jgi:WD40 repeat protein
VQARARTTILKQGEQAIEALRRAIGAPEGMFAEQMFALADDLGRERRSVRFAQGKDLGEKGWKIAWRAGGRQLALLQDLGGTVRMLDAELQPTDEKFGEQTAYFALDPKDETLAYNIFNKGRPSEVAIVERKSGRRVSIAVGDQAMLAYSPDGKHIATGGYGRAVDLYSVADGAFVRRFGIARTETDGGLTPVFSPDGRLLVVGNRNDKTNIFDVESGERLQVLDRGSTHQPAFSPDGTLLAICYVDGKIGIWNVATGTLTKLLDGEGKEAFTVAWSPDGKLLASAGLAGPIVIWSGKHLAALHRLDPGSERTFCLAFRPDGKLLVAAGNQTTRAWTIGSQR